MNCPHDFPSRALFFTPWETAGTMAEFTQAPCVRALLSTRRAVCFTANSNGSLVNTLTCIALTASERPNIREFLAAVEVILRVADGHNDELIPSSPRSRLSKDRR